MSEDHKAIVRRVFEVVSTHDLDSLDELIAVDANWTGMGEGREGIKAGVRAMFDAFPDVSVAIEEIITEGDQVVVRSHCTGTHLGDYEGIPATGKPFNQVEQVDIVRIRDGRVTEGWKLTDNLAFMQQLGLIPTE